MFTLTLAKNANFDTEYQCFDLYCHKMDWGNEYYIFADQNTIDINEALTELQNYDYIQIDQALIVEILFYILKDDHVKIDRLLKDYNLV